MNNKQLFEKLWETIQSPEVHRVLNRLGDKSNAGLDAPFGKENVYMWKAFGGNTSNVSTINLATDPGRALVERLTNAFDAVVERKKPASGKIPTSFRAALSAWFGRPKFGRDQGLFNWKHEEVDRKILTVLHPGAGDDYPTVDVVDHGIGLSPEQFPKTILSLQAGNKITKFYLGGTWGQGGSASLAFSQFVVIFSIRDGKLAFTVIRELEMGAGWKENTYAYLCNGDGAVPSVEVEGLKVEGADWTQGTIVRHTNYKLTNLDGPFISTPGNLYHFLNYALFDPALPSRVVDHREKYTKTRTGAERTKVRDEAILGSRNRLLARQNRDKKTEEKTGPEIVYHRALEYVKPVGDTSASIGIEYWVVYAWRKDSEGKIILRPQSNELYLQTAHPVVATINGQVHGTMTTKLLRECKYDLLSKHIIVHIDCTEASAKVRRELFSTTREGFKMGPVYAGLEKALRDMLTSDERLIELEGELADRVVQAETRRTSAEVKEQVVEILTREGFKRSVLGPAQVRGGKLRAERVAAEESAGEGGGGGEGGGEVEQLPLPEALPFPQVTTWAMVDEKVELSPGQNKVVRVRTDAAREFFDKGLIGIRFEPDVLEVVSAIVPSDGEYAWRIRTKEPAEHEEIKTLDEVVGKAGQIIATITQPDGRHMTATAAFEVVAEPPRAAHKDQDKIPAFEIIPVSPMDTELWSTVWSDLDPRRATENEIESASFRVMPVGEAIHIYYSSVFKEYKVAHDKIDKRSKPLARIFDEQYQVWTAIYALRQYLDERSTEDSGTPILERERSRAARVAVRVCTQTAQLLYTSSRKLAAGAA